MRRHFLLAALLAALTVPAHGAAIDAGSSWIVAVTGKAGALGFVGHEHAILVTDWKGDVDWNPNRPSSSRARITAPSAKLQIDSKRAREIAGLTGGPDEATVKKLQAKLLDGEHLDAEKYPEIVLEATGVEGEKGKALELVGALTLHGKTHKIRVPLEVAQDKGGATSFRGKFAVKHSDFGMKPESVGGVVNVADEVSIRFQITLAK